MSKKTALIFGSQGQDGQLLTEFLISKNYHVVGIDRATTLSSNGEFFEFCDFTRITDVTKIIQKTQPDEIYHLAAIHHSSEEHMGASDQLFRLSLEINTLSLVNILEVIKQHVPHCRLFYAASSHLFGDPKEEIQNELTQMNPDSAYGITKLAGMLTCKMYREQSQLFTVTGILYNHESHLRTPKFLTKKIIQAVLSIKNGSKQKLVVGDLNATIDWGYAPDYVRAMHATLQLDSATDFIIATGKKHTVKDFIRIAFDHLQLDWTQHTIEDHSIPLRRTQIRIGDPSKLMKQTGWQPTVSFQEMITLLIDHEAHQTIKGNVT